MATRDQKFWILLIFLLAGIVVGGILNEMAISMGAPSFLTNNYSFGIDNPISLNFQVLKFQLSFLININIFTIIGMLIGVFVYRKI